ncbi:MAG TPA: GTP-binding protein [Acidimicrobiales bacterium]|nr:GTP-binding protein [Acidimicrobiales bacterium]
MHEAKVPVVVVSGWSPRASREALEGQQPGWPVVVRPARAEPWVAERSLGCPCCMVRLDTRTALRRLLARREPPEGIVVLTHPGEDPGPLLATVLCDLLLVRRARLDAFLVVVDGPEAAVRTATGQPFAAGSGQDHLALADAILVGRGDRLTDQARDAVTAALKAANPYSPVLRAGDGGGDGWLPRHHPGNGAYALGAVASRLDAIAGAAPSSAGMTLLDIEGEGDADALRAWAAGLFREHGHRLLRLQAVCALRGRPERWACSAFRSVHTFGACSPSPAGPPRARVLAVGRHLDVDRLSGSLQQALAAST